MKDEFVSEVRMTLFEYNEIIEESREWEKYYQASDEELCTLKKKYNKAIETIKVSLLEIVKGKYSYTKLGSVNLYRREILDILENDFINSELLYNEFLEFKKQQEEEQANE